MKLFKTLRKRGLALFLVLTMCMSMLPANALAANRSEQENDPFAQVTHRELLERLGQLYGAAPEELSRFGVLDEPMYLNQFFGLVSGAVRLQLRDELGEEVLADITREDDGNPDFYREVILTQTGLFVEDEAPVEDETYAEDKAPVEDETSAEDEAPVEDETSAEDEALVADKTPTEIEDMETMSESEESLSSLVLTPVTLWAVIDEELIPEEETSIEDGIQTLADSTTRVYLYVKMMGTQPESWKPYINSYDWVTVGYIDVPSSQLGSASDSQIKQRVDLPEMLKTALADLSNIGCGSEAVTFYTGNSSISGVDGKDPTELLKAIDFRAVNWEYGPNNNTAGLFSDQNATGYVKDKTYQWHLNGVLDWNCVMEYSVEGEVPAVGTTLYSESEKAVVVPNTPMAFTGLSSENYSAKRQTSEAGYPAANTTYYTYTKGNSDAYAAYPDAKYVFSGWTDPNTNSTFPDETSYSGTITGTWTKTPLYTVIYDLNGGTKADGNELVHTKLTKGEKTPTISNPTRDGYTFDGWSAEVAETVTGNVTYTAQWTDDPPDISDGVKKSAVDKDGKPLDSVLVGDTVYYTVTVTPSKEGGLVKNLKLEDDKLTSTAQITTVTVGGSVVTADNQAENGNITIALPAATRETIVVTYTFEVTEGYLNRGNNSVTNTVNVTAWNETVPENPEPASDTVTLHVGQPDVTVTKEINKVGGVDYSDGAKAKVGDTIEWTITVSNQGKAPAQNVVVTDEFTIDGTAASGLEIKDQSGNKVATENGEFTVGNIAAGDSETYTATYKVTENDVGKTISNTASAEGHESDTTIVVEKKSVAIQKSVAITRDGELVTGEAKVGDTLTYTITVKNTGNVVLTNLAIEDTFSGTGTVMQKDQTVTKDADGKYTFHVDSLSVDASTTITYTYTVQPEDAGQKLTNTAVAQSGVTTEPEEEPGNTTETEVSKLQITGITKELMLTAPADVNNVPDDVSFAKDGNEGIVVPADAGSVTLLYKITVTGDVGAKFSIEDNGATPLIPGALNGEIGGTGSCVVYVTMTFTKNGDGQYVNQVQSTALTNQASVKSEDGTQLPADPNPESKAYIVTVKYVDEAGNSLYQYNDDVVGSNYSRYADYKIIVPAGAKYDVSNAIKSELSAVANLQNSDRSTVNVKYVLTDMKISPESAADEVDSMAVNGAVGTANSDITITLAYKQADIRYTVEYYKGNEKMESAPDGAITMGAAQYGETVVLVAVAADSVSGTAVAAFPDVIEDGTDHYVYDTTRPATITVTAGANVIKVYYLLDNKGGENGPDGIPDEYEAFVEYKAVYGSTPVDGIENAASAVSVVTKTYDLRDHTTGGTVILKTSITADAKTAMQTIAASNNESDSYAFDKWVTYDNRTFTTLELGAQTINGVEGGRTYTFTANYAVDNWNDSENGPDSETGGDGIPDKYQAIVRYQSTDSRAGTVAPTVQVFTVEKVGGAYQENWSLPATAESTATAESGYVFAYWSEEPDGKTGDALSVVSTDAEFSKQVIFSNTDCAKTFYAFFLEDKMGPDGNPDGTPDAWQVFVNFAADENGSLEPQNPAAQVFDYYKKDANGEYIINSDGSLTPVESIALTAAVTAVPNSGMSFEKWELTSDKTDEVLETLSVEMKQVDGEIEVVNKTLNIGKALDIQEIIPGATYTYTAKFADQKIAYSIIRHFIDRGGNEVGRETAAPSAGEIVTVKYGTSASEVIAQYSDASVSYEGTTYLYDTAKITGVTVDSQTLTDYTVIDLYYDIDSLDKNNPDTPGSDNVADKDQIIFTYVASENGNLSGRTTEIKDKVNGAASPENIPVPEAGTGYAFDFWRDSTNNAQDFDKDMTSLKAVSYTEDTEFAACFDTDAIGETSTEEGDGIPDKYQVTFTYVESEGGRVTGTKTEVVTRRENGNLSLTAPVSPRAEVTAEADAGYTFSKWAVGSDPRFTYSSVDGIRSAKFSKDTTFTAYFQRNSYQLTIKYLLEDADGVELIDTRVFSSIIDYDLTDIVNAQAEITASNGDYAEKRFVLIGNSGNLSGQLTADTVVKLFYSLDEIGSNGPDGVADKYQVIVRFKSADEDMGTISGELYQVLTLKDEDGKYAAEGTVTPETVTPKPKGENRFDTWMKDSASVSDPFVEMNAQGGKTYTFTAYFYAPNEVVVRANSAALTYNGLEQSVTGCTVTSGYTVEGVSASASRTNSGTTTVTVTAEDTVIVKDAEGNDVTERVKIRYEDGALTITPATLTVTTPSASRAYNGVALTAGPATIAGLVNGETATVTATGSQTAVGSSQNGYTIDWGTAAAGNYTVTAALGTLTVTAAAAPVTPAPVTPTPTPSTGGTTNIPSTPVPTTSTDETDIAENETPLAAPGLNNVDHFDYIKGYGDGTVRPDARITRAEVATIFFRLMTEEFRSENWATENAFSDVAAGDWYNNAISTAAQAGILRGYADGSFQPNNAITRAEFAAIAARFASDVVPVGGMFSDIEGHWAQEDIERAAAAGWIQGSAGLFRPNEYITRAEAITLINRMLDRVPDEECLLEDMIVFSDNQPGKWYYADVQEATNSHDYNRDEIGVTEIWTGLLEAVDWTALEKEWATAATTVGVNVGMNLTDSGETEGDTQSDTVTADGEE